MNEREILIEKLQQKNAELLKVKNEITNLEENLKSYRDKKEDIDKQILEINKKLKNLEL